MNKKILVIALTLAMLALPISMVFAKNNTKFIDVSGSLTALGTAPPVFTPVGNSDQIKVTITENTMMWGGSFEDSIAVASSHWMVHNNGITAWNIQLLDAEFDGKSGTITILSAQGNWRILGGTGDFTNIHGKGTIAVVAAPFLYSFEGQIHYDP